MKLGQQRIVQGRGRRLRRHPLRPVDQRRPRPRLRHQPQPDRLDRPPHDAHRIAEALALGISSLFDFTAGDFNLDLTYVVMNNQTYGLTKGQVSPTSDLGYRTTTTPAGNIEGAIDPMAIAISPTTSP
jgi:hypothetical protein